MAQVVINSCFGGFSLSRAAFLRLREMGNKCALEERDYGEKYDDGSVREPICGTEMFCSDIPRDDPDLIAVVRDMGETASGSLAQLAVVEIPDNVAWEIDEYDGNEHVAEQHRTWG